MLVEACTLGAKRDGNAAADPPLLGPLPMEVLQLVEPMPKRPLTLSLPPLALPRPPSAPPLTLLPLPTKPEHGDPGPLPKFPLVGRKPPLLLLSTDGRGGRDGTGMGTGIVTGPIACPRPLSDGGSRLCEPGPRMNEFGKAGSSLKLWRMLLVAIATGESDREGGRKARSEKGSEQQLKLLPSVASNVPAMSGADKLRQCGMA